MSGESYRPSNGTEGMMFEDKFCCNCIHEKYCHTGVHGDKTCEIQLRAFMFDQRDKEYPKEWVYDDNDKPTCTAHVHWDWGSDDDGNGFNEPPPVEPYNPNQLVMPFEIEQTLKDADRKLVNS